MNKTLGMLRREGAAFLASSSDSPAVDANTLLAYVCGMSFAQLLANPDASCTEEQCARFESLLKQRRSGVPIAYLLRQREFMSLSFAVTPDVLIPRPDTELLVETVLARYPKAAASADGWKGLEIGVGSGCISVSLARYGSIDMIGVDISEAALAVAHRNAMNNGAADRVTFVKGDLFAPLTDADAGQFDFIVSNPPYIPSAEIAMLATDVRDYEPTLALDGGASGLDFYERLAEDGMRWLKPQGMIFWEIGHNQRQAATELLQNRGWRDIVCRQDLAGLDRVVFATRA